MNLLNEIKLDKWQERVLERKGNIVLRTGRQVGKSTIVAKKAAKLAQEYENSNTLIIAAAQRQSSHLFEKVMMELTFVHEDKLKLAGGWQDNPKASNRQNHYAKKQWEQENGLFLERPTKTEVKLNNGSRIYSLPAGKSGVFIRGLSLDFLIADEAAYIPEAVWVAVTPMMAVSKKLRGLGWTILLSTPFGKGGYFFNAFYDDDFMQIHVSSESCPRIPKSFLMKEKKRMSKMEYAQEYLGEFIDDWNQFFPTKLIKERMKFIGWDRERQYNINYRYYAGVDIARYGEDETAIVIMEQKKEKCKIVKVIIYDNMKITETARALERLNKLYNFRSILVDSAGLGAGVLDLLQESLGKSRVVGLDNSSKSIDDKRSKKILKEDLYSNALKMMELEEVELISELKLLKSLKSMQFEYNKEKNLRIFGNYSHISEAFVRVCWSKRQKKLKLFIA